MIADGPTAELKAKDLDRLKAHLRRQAAEALIERARSTGVWEAVRAERIHAHEKHGDTSMESMAVTDMTRLSVLMEEVGEVAREFNEARRRVHDGILPQREREQSLDLDALYDELIQVAAMAGAWADAIGAYRDTEAGYA